MESLQRNSEIKISAKCLLALKCKHANALFKDNVAAGQLARFENCNVECFFFT